MSRAAVTFLARPSASPGRSPRERLIGFLFVLASASMGCSVQLEALSTPPPTKSATLDSEDEHIEISAGIALAFECTSQGAPCQDATAEVEDTSIATVQGSYLDELKNAGREGMAPGSIFVIVGRAEGTTTLTVSADEGDVEYEVEVVP